MLYLITVHNFTTSPTESRLCAMDVVESADPDFSFAGKGLPTEVADLAKMLGTEVLRNYQGTMSVLDRANDRTEYVALVSIARYVPERIGTRVYRKGEMDVLHSYQLTRTVVRGETTYSTAVVVDGWDKHYTYFDGKKASA